MQFPKFAGRVYSYVMQMLYTYVYVDSYDNIDVCIPTDFNEFCVFTSSYNGVDPPVKGIGKKNCQNEILDTFRNEKRHHSYSLLKF